MIHCKIWPWKAVVKRLIQEMLTSSGLGEPNSICEFILDWYMSIYFGLKLLEQNEHSDAFNPFQFAMSF